MPKGIEDEKSTTVESDLLLRDVLAAAPRPTLTALTAPRGLDIRVLGSSMIDLTDPELPPTDGVVLLLAGAWVDDEATFSFVRRAGLAGAAAVVVKRRSRPVDQLVVEASAVGVCLLQAAESASWPALDALISSLVGVTGLGPAANGWSGTEELFAIANTLAAVFGGSVAIEDLERRVLAYSLMPGQRIDPVREAGILQRRVPNTQENRTQYQKVFAASGVVRFSRMRDELARSAVSVKAGVVPLGTIWAIESDDDAAGDELSIQTRERKLLEASRVAAVHLLRAHHAGEIEQLVRGEALLNVLHDGELPASMRSRIGIRNGQVVLLAITLISTTPFPPMPAVAAEARRYLAAFSSQAVVATTPSNVYVLLPELGAQGAHRLALEVREAVERTVGITVRVAVSSTGTFPHDMPTLYSEVAEVLRASYDTDLPSVVEFGDVLDRVLLQRLREVIASDPRLLHPAVDRLRKHDEQHGGDLRRTLLIWLETQGDVSATAAKLTMHPNTVRYRIRRAREVVGVNLENPDIKLSLWLQLRAEQLAPTDTI
jgi:hypothetical protein